MRRGHVAAHDDLTLAPEGVDAGDALLPLVVVGRLAAAGVDSLDDVALGVTLEKVEDMGVGRLEAGLLDELLEVEEELVRLAVPHEAPLESNLRGLGQVRVDEDLV